MVGTVDPASGAVRVARPGEQIGNSFAVDETGGVYIVTDKAMYRFDAAPAGAPSVTWREAYANIGIKKPGQTQAGSGTTPTLMGTQYVAITDNADPMNVVVYRRARRGDRRAAGLHAAGLRPGRRRHRPVADRHRPLDRRREQLRLQRADRDEQGATTTPGLERVDINDSGTGCRTVWHSDELAPSVVPEAVAGERPRLHVHEAAGRRRHRRLVLHGDRLPHRQDRLQATGRDRARLQQQLRAGHASAPTGPPTWACSAGSCCSATGSPTRTIGEKAANDEPAVRPQRR